MIETKTYLQTLPESILCKYEFLETGSAAQIASVVNPSAFEDILDVLDSFAQPRVFCLQKAELRSHSSSIDGASSNEAGLRPASTCTSELFFFLAKMLQQ